MGNIVRRIIAAILVISVPVLLFAQPANDLCTNARVLTPGATCAPLTGQTLLGANSTSGLPNNCGNASSADVWYRFIATAANPTITLSNLGTGNPSITNAGVRIQLFSGSCGSMASIACVSGTSLITPAASPLTVGSTYYIRIYTNSATAPSGANFGFSICVVNPPSNDLCANATLLTSSTTCSGLANETLLYATASSPAVPGNCGNAASADVWYRFVANSPFPTVMLSNLGTGNPSITNAGVRLQLLSGTCAGLTNVACVSTTTLQTNITPGGAGLTVGNTYYVRVYTNSGTAPSGANFDFDICVVDPPDNDLCADAQIITSSPSAVPVAGTMNNASYSTGTPTCGGTPRYDVWYRFLAKSVNPTIAITGAGANFSTPRIQVLSGTCAGLTNVGCNAGSYTPTSLTIGTYYYIRVYSTSTTIPTTNADFNISITDPAPANNNCSAPTTLTASATCSPVTGTLYASTNDGTSTACGTSQRDVWYRFVANTPNPSVTLSDLGSQFTHPGIQVFAGSNCSSLTSMGCIVNDSSLSLTGLNAGTIYLIRVFSTSGAAPSDYPRGSFSICVTDPPPANDLCEDATSLVSGTNPAYTAGTLKNSTVSTGVPGSCGVAGSVDVWYSFVAQSEYPSIQLNNIGTNFSSAGPRVQLLSGTCGSMTSLGCTTSPLNTLTVVAGAGLTPGQTYYIRVTTNASSSGTTGSAWNFGIRVVDPAAPTAPRYGNSYVNISKRNIGGVVEPGDTLEIRMTLQHSTGMLIRPRYLDNIPSYTSMLTTDSIRVITNEGITYKRYTPLAGDDAATYVANPGPGEYNIRLNFGWGTNLRAAGVPLTNALNDTSGAAQMPATNVRPTNGSRLLFATSFRVVVTGNPGDVITLGNGRFVYRNSAAGPDIYLNTTPYQILISTPLGLCSDATGVNNAAEFGGTFGNGTTLNRSTNLENTLGAYTYVPNMGPGVSVGDGTYGIIKNLSPTSSTNKNARRMPNCGSGAPANEDCNNRMFSAFDIDGDHTGTNDAIGNLPPSSSDAGGYMLLVNADYVSSETYRQTITGLCPNTYYEFSAWIRNICPVCGADSTGAQTYTPGVLPNLTFVMDGIDRYSTGQVDVTGWEKKGFVFKTDPGQTSATFSIRNNAQGGGGNDWVMDDISIVTCLPTMSYSPTLNPVICQGVPITIDDTVRSYFDNYTHFVWQRSIDSGTNWTTITSPTSIVPTFNGTDYEYITSYTIPGSSTALSDSGDMYRVIVATDILNLGNSYCQVTDGINIINLNVQTCVVLSSEFHSLNGRLNNNYSTLNWVTLQENEPLQYIIERSNDGVTFRKAGLMPGNMDPNAEKNYYSFNDPEAVFDQAYYRIAMVGQDGKIKYSKVIKLSARNKDAFMLQNVVNPFGSSLDFEISITQSGKIDVDLVDMYGKVVRRKSYDVGAGTTRLSLPNTGSLASGVYILRVMNKGELLTKKVLKENR